MRSNGRVSVAVAGVLTIGLSHVVLSDGFQVGNRIKNNNAIGPRPVRGTKRDLKSVDGNVVWRNRRRISTKVGAFNPNLRLLPEDYDESEFYPLETDPYSCLTTDEECYLHHNAPSAAFASGRKKDGLSAVIGFLEGVDWEAVFEVVVPLAAPFFAFHTYDYVAKAYEVLVEHLSTGTKNWVAVDGGAYQAKIMAPAINGVVLPAIAVLFATLTSTTISTLRQRQVEVRKAINMEAGELRVMEYLVNSFPTKTATASTVAAASAQSPAEHSPPAAADFVNGNVRHGLASSSAHSPVGQLTPPLHINGIGGQGMHHQNNGPPVPEQKERKLDPELQDRFRNYLIQYTSRIIGESQTRYCHAFFAQPDGSNANYSNINPRRGMDSELNGVLQLLNEHYDSIPIHLADEAYVSVGRLREHRHNRITALQSTYPRLHYALLSVLALAQCTGFLMETNTELLVFLNSIQLKMLWSGLVGAFVACFTVFYDLGSPFSGSYQISASVDQLYTVRLALVASAKLQQKQRLEEQERLEREQAILMQQQIPQQPVAGQNNVHDPAGAELQNGLKANGQKQPTYGVTMENVNGAGKGYVMKSSVLKANGDLLSIDEGLQHLTGTSHIKWQELYQSEGQELYQSEWQDLYQSEWEECGGSEQQELHRSER